MALNYNLSKVYVLSTDDSEFVFQFVSLFVIEIPKDLKQLEHALKSKDYELILSLTHKIKPSLDMLGMTIAYEDVNSIESWSKAKGKKKEIIETIQNLKTQIEKTTKEIKKDFNIN